MSTTADNIQETNPMAANEENKFIPISHDLDDNVKSNHKQRYSVLQYIYICIYKQFRFFKFKRSKTTRTVSFEITA